MAPDRAASAAHRPVPRGPLNAAVQCCVVVQRRDLGFAAGNFRKRTRSDTTHGTPAQSACAAAYPKPSYVDGTATTAALRRAQTLLRARRSRAFRRASQRPVAARVRCIRARTASADRRSRAARAPARQDRTRTLEILAPFDRADGENRPPVPAGRARARKTHARPRDRRRERGCAIGIELAATRRAKTPSRPRWRRRTVPRSAKSPEIPARVRAARALARAATRRRAPLPRPVCRAHGIVPAAQCSNSRPTRARAHGSNT